MTSNVCTRTIVAAMCWLAAGQAWSQETAQSQFERGYFLQSHAGDLKAAAEQYQHVTSDESAPEALRNEAKQRLAACQEDLAASDLARLMPADALAYVELANPGEHVANLVGMLGLAGTQNPSATSSTPSVTQIERGLYFPDDFTVSPHLVAEIKKIKGVAVSVTSVNQRGEPDGVAIVHPGDSGLIRGLLETGVQMLKPEAPVAGFRTYRVEDADVLITVTNRLFVASRQREQLEAAVARLQNSDGPSLATEAHFQQAQEERKGALLFAFVDGPRALKAFGPMMRGQEAAIARALLDLEHLHSVSAVVRTTKSAVEAQVTVDLADGHRNVLYSLLRTAPLTRRSLEHVPAGAAGIAIIGLNRPGAAQSDTAEASQQYVSLMDVGREIFSNIEEIGVFVMPTSAGDEIPDFGVVLAVKNPERSEKLWNQLLSLPAMVAPSEMPAPTEIEIDGQRGQQYQFPDMPPIAVVKSADAAIVGGTRAAVEASVRAKGTGTTITSDEGFKSLLGALTDESSKAVLVHVGRAVATAGAMAHGREAEELKQIGAMVNEMRVLVVTDEAPTQFKLRAAASGLPNVPAVVKTVIQQEHGALSQTESANP